MADLNLVLWTASGVLVTSALLFGYALKKMAGISSKQFSRAERRVGDVGIFLSHVSEDLTHARRAFGEKIHADAAHARILKTAAALGLKEPEAMVAFAK